MSQSAHSHQRNLPRTLNCTSSSYFINKQIGIIVTMAEEPQPPNVQEGADQPDVLPANAEDRKAAQAMSSLDAKGEEDAAPKKEIDLKALNDAMKNLGVASEQKKPDTVKKEGAPKKLIKVDQADVTLLVC